MSQYENKFKRDVLTEVINVNFQSRMLRLAEEEIITPEDVEKCVDNIQELTL